MKNSAKYQKEYYQKNSEKIRRYYQMNQDTILRRVKKHYYKTHNIRLQKMREYCNTIKGRLRRTYGDMNNCCNNPKNKRYHRYGGRGIELKFTSDEFVDYVVNELQIDPRGLTIDRIDNDGHYEPGNIRFVTRVENNKNR